MDFLVHFFYNDSMEYKDIIKIEKGKKYFKDIIKFLDDLDSKNIIYYPERKNIFKAFELTSFDNTKVVVIGQDPYFNEYEAHGLSFSVYGEKITPTLRNIFKELKDDLGIVRCDTNLTDWALQGVLLLNMVLTVEKKKPLSHKTIGWQNFTYRIIQELNKKDDIVFVLWGNESIKLRHLLTNQNNLVLTSSHPSPLSSYRGFFGSKVFSKINNFLKERNKEVIKW